MHGNTTITERRFDLPREEDTENKAMETRHTSHTATLLAKVLRNIIIHQQIVNNHLKDNLNIMHTILPAL